MICLECGASFKQLSTRHLRLHDLDGRSYRAKYGIPRAQSLAARETTARRRQIVQRIRPWEKAPTNPKVKSKAAVTKKAGGRPKQKAAAKKRRRQTRA